ncbi:hypothetical protein F441_21395 [Phytophthora nicotianae CJ01A1]|uniref:Uncharacterized protein n=6 Tax=Phytophthora nicotianae TaxID=4792 RepID=W2QU28_PHYN3|nr:hypothetical protein PPTG_06247 [Phytophthora nicotianae INRA-310]ETI31510.1 hypothetical protein F443_21514 [Phytophthora nicotianae P1569]ETK71912.1 hypothetical protein L915_20908 [Phytophthora nicotianae]ETO60239.1 hypothetical protein F444_21524 [Phytophthora nicotianae P1976]ETP01340.1 hypothetical protein F441_21395 [Phytophthora nicotianae CJ01A1]ETP29500.1 hypothetical protein F442_21347 [Phytophthora nicotianae P10297]
MAIPFDNPSKVANDVKSNVKSNVKGNKFATPLMIAAGVGALAWFMASDRKHEPAPPHDRDPRAPPSKMK